MSSLTPPHQRGRGNWTQVGLSPPGLFVRLRVNQKLMTDGVRLDLRKKVTDGVQSEGRIRGTT